MRRDFIFVIKGVSKRLCIAGENLVIAQFNEEDGSQAAFVRTLKIDFDLQNWASESDSISICVVRNDFEKMEDGFDAAFDTISGCADVFDLIVDDGVALGPIVGVRDENRSDAALFLFSKNSGRIRVHSKDGGAEARWGDRTLKIRNRLFPAFAAAAQKMGPTTELSNQLTLSLKMFRHGSVAPGFGIEFLCKFSALEGLVCGATSEKKKALLVRRISSLLPGPTDWKQKVTDLWRRRCEASHQGKAFCSGFVQATADVEFIFLAVVVFASERLASVKTIDDLWRTTPAYSVPPEVVQEPETLRGRGSRAMMPLTKSWSAIGTTIDALFQLTPPKATESDPAT